MDTTGNMLTTLINAQRVGKERAVLPYSKFTESILKLMQEKKTIATYRLQEGPKPKLVVTLSYSDDETPVITGVRRISKPGRKQYTAASDIPYSSKGNGYYIISSSSGLHDDRKARSEGIGGEIVCEVW